MELPVSFLFLKNISGVAHFVLPPEKILVSGVSFLNFRFALAGLYSYPARFDFLAGLASWLRPDEVLG